MIYIVSSVLTESALLEWKYICRHNKVPASWKDFKCHFRDIFIPVFYAVHLRFKLDNLKKDSMTIKEYFYYFKVCIMFGVLDECREDTMSKFMKGLNCEIQILLIC